MKTKKKAGIMVSFAAMAIVGIMLFCGIGLSSSYPSGPNPSCGDNANYIYYDTAQIAEYNFNEGSGTTTRDDSGRGKTGTIYEDEIENTNHQMWASEKDGNFQGYAALTFDGDDYVQVADDSDFDFSEDDVDAFVISAMINTESDNEYLMICSKYYRIPNPDPEFENDRDYDLTWGFTLYLTDGQARFSAYNGREFLQSCNVQDSDGADLRDGEWHFVAIEYNYGIYNLFVDPDENNYNSVETVTDNTVQPGNTDTDFFIGRRDISWDHNKDFEGEIDCVYLYEIDKAMVSTPPVYPVRMFGKDNLCYWGFDEGSADSNDIVNDRVRWTSQNAGYHHYGKMKGSGIGFASRASAWNGEHCLSLSGGQPYFDRVKVADPVNQLDFNAGQGAENIYIEFLFEIGESGIPVQPAFAPLVAKIDDTITGPQNGYRVILDKDQVGNKYLRFQTYNNGLSATLSSTNVNFINGRWYHVYAWINNGVMNLYCFDESYSSVKCIRNSMNTVGIGPTTTDLYIGSCLNYNGMGGVDHIHNCYFSGLMDDVVLSPCYPN